jgi:ketosteroid isomerase-like protein
MPRVETSRQAIERLILTYAERIDRGDFAGVGELFADGVISGPDGDALARGRAEVESLYERTTRRYEDGTPRTKHVTSNLRVDVDEAAGTARSASYFTVLQGLPDFPLQAIVAGRYEDRFERAGEGWRFAERRMFVDLVGDVSRHLRIALPRS